ncbi:MAG TPA: ABC transporter permease subunit [Massilibacterium sp.]|nr:ABC transporter permease subunit [Massilibacterium sp.]
MLQNKSLEAPVSLMYKTSRGKIKITTWTKSRIVITFTFLTLVLLTFIGFFTFDYKDLVLQQAVVSTLENMKTMFLQPALHNFSLLEATYQVGVTVGLAFLATIIGAFFSFFIALFTAKNLSTPWLSNTIIVIIAFIRAVPTVLWVLIFAIAAGLGSEAAVLGMLLHTVSFLVKAFAESFEELDQGVIEALRASGANWWHIVTHAVLPTSITSLISWTFLRFETNFTVAVAMGAAAGAGGIGFELFMSSSFYFDIQEVGFITYAILAVALVLEITSTQLKKKFILSTK